MECVSNLCERWSALNTPEVDRYLCELLKELKEPVAKSQHNRKRKREEGEKKIPTALYQVTVGVLVAHGYLKSGDIVYCEIWEPKDGYSSEVILRRHEGRIGENGSLWPVGDEQDPSLSFKTPSQLSNHFYQQAVAAAGKNPSCRLQPSPKTRKNGWTYLTHASEKKLLGQIRQEAWKLFLKKKSAI